LYLDLAYPDRAAKLRVTDVRFYESDHQTVKRGIANDVNRRISSGRSVYAMLGLARAMYDADAERDVHWLQVNGICLSDRPVGHSP